jgi:hypothetical protein
MDQLDRDVFLRMSKRAELTILAIHDVVRVVSTEFGFVVVRLKVK